SMNLTVEIVIVLPVQNELKRLHNQLIFFRFHEFDRKYSLPPKSFLWILWDCSIDLINRRKITDFWRRICLSSNLNCFQAHTSILPEILWIHSNLISKKKWKLSIEITMIFLEIGSLKTIVLPLS